MINYTQLFVITSRIVHESPIGVGENGGCAALEFLRKVHGLRTHRSRHDWPIRPWPAQGSKARLPVARRSVAILWRVSKPRKAPRRRIHRASSLRDPPRHPLILRTLLRPYFVTHRGW